MRNVPIDSALLGLGRPSQAHPLRQARTDSRGTSPARGGGGHRAFSLVEVLIAVFVLSLGMLGLASIFPVVLRQQRTAGEVTEASIALGSVEALLRSNLDLNAKAQDEGWGIFQDDADQNDGWSFDERWEVPIPWAPGDPAPDSRMGVDVTTSRLRIFSEDPTGPANDPFGDDILIPLSARLSPSAFVRGANPRVEWIVAARRIITEVDASNNRLPTEQDELEVAVFIRPIDRAIQVPRRDRANKNLWGRFGRAITLSDVILANEIADNGGTPAIQASEARLPVALNARTNQPSDNGTGYYASLYTVPLKDYQFDADPNDPADDRDRLQLDFQPNDPALPLTTQVGQRLVDRRGNIYTVRGVSGRGANTVILIDPPVPASIAGSMDVSGLVASPIVPVAVEVFRVRP